MNNLTGRNQTRIQEPLCQHGIYGTHQKMLLSVLNIPISITAFLGNVLIIVALKRVSSIHPPSKLLLSCLATTDLCVGLITLPVYDAYILTPEYSRSCIFLKIMTNISNGVLGGVSMFTLTAISVDRLLALFLGVRYRQVVTLKRMRVIVATFWILCIALSMLFFYSFGIAMIIAVTFMLLCITISNVCYARIYLKLHQHRVTRPQCSPRTTSWTRNSTKYSTIQKDSVHCSLGANDVNGVLSSLWCGRCCSYLYGKTYANS